VTGPRPNRLASPDANTNKWDRATHEGPNDDDERKNDINCSSVINV
jgi:hypothetical protein